MTEPERVPDPQDPKPGDIFEQKSKSHYRIKITAGGNGWFQVWYMDGPGVMIGGGAWGRHGSLSGDVIARFYRPRLPDLDIDQAVAELADELDLLEIWPEVWPE